jgi:uncharacterized membrane protein YkvA (DUF1232 family)
MDSVINNLKERARILKRETLTLYFAARDPRTAWYAKVVVAGVVAYGGSRARLSLPTG